MPDRNPTPEKELERELRELGSRLEYPPTPDLAMAVRRQIDEEGVQPTRRGWLELPYISPRWAAAAAVLLLFLTVPAFSPAVRDTLSGLFTAGQGAGGSGPPVGENASPGVAGSSGSPESAGDRSSPRESPLPSEEGFDRRIIKTADLGIRSEDVRRSAARAQQIAAEFGGSVQSSRIERNAGPVSANLVLTVPSPEFEDALNELRGLGKTVTTDSVSGEDVTEEFVDLESRERNLLAAEQSLLKLYDEAESVNDSLAIQRELTDVRGQIEQVQGRIKYLEQRTDSSRIELDIRPVGDETETGWSPLRVATQAWNASLGVLQALATTVISVAVFSWWLIPLPVAGFVWWRRRHRASDDAPDSP